MADEVFKQSRKKITPEELGSRPPQAQGDDPLGHVKQIQDAVGRETGKDVTRPVDQSPFEISGNIPPEFRDALMRRAAQGPTSDPVAPPLQLPQPNVPRVQKSRGRADDVDHGPPPGAPEEEDGYEVFEAPPDKPRPHVQQRRPTPDAKIRMTGSDALEGLLQKLAGDHKWETFEFPSKGKFYQNIPGVVNVRAMTGEEEQILSTPRWVKKGKAIDMIFRRCIKEPINTEELLSIDRTHLLIFLRGISYTPEYDVEIKCPNCTIKFAHVIQLDDLDVELCPDNFGMDNLSGLLPASGFSYTFRLATGADEQEISTYRENRINKWGDQGEDDTLLYRTALLLEEIEGVTMKKELALLLKKLPIQDVAHLRNEINQPPFGVKTQLPLLCPNCTEEFKIDLPMETNFFFPRKKEERTQA